MAAASFRWILQLHKDVPRATKFYSQGLDFTVNVCTLRWAELQSGPLKLALLHSPRTQNLLANDEDLYAADLRLVKIKAFLGGEEDAKASSFSSLSALEKEYSSLLSFTVTDINNTVTKLMALGAELDGPIKYEIHGKVAAMRCLDGHMVGLYEPA